MSLAWMVVTRAGPADRVAATVHERAAVKCLLCLNLPLQATLKAMDGKHSGVGSASRHGSIYHMPPDVMTTVHLQTCHHG